MEGYSERCRHYLINEKMLNKTGSLRLPKIFYGWWIVSSCFLTTLLIGGVVAFGFTAFFEPIVNEFGWTYTQVSLAASIRGVETGLFAPLMGFLVDRVGTRRLMFGGIILIGAGLISLSYTASLAMFYCAFALVAIGNSGLGPTVLMTVVANWFRKKIGIATGIMISGHALGGLLVPVIVRLIDLFTWRTAIFILGLAILIIGLPLTLIVRHKPEQYSYLPDGEQNDIVLPHSHQVQKQDIKLGVAVKEAFKKRAYWHISLSLALQFLTFSAVITHVMPYLSSIGIARSTSSLVVTAIPLVSIIGRLSSGWLSDRFYKKRVAAVFSVVIALGLLSFNYVSGDWIWLLAVSIIFIGIGWGALSPMRAALVREYFGTAGFGTILGFVMGLIAIGNTIGPILTGWIFDTWGNYNVAWLLYACLVFVALIIMATTPSVGNDNRSFDKI